MTLLLGLLAAVAVVLVVVVVRSSSRIAPSDPSTSRTSPWFARAHDVLRDADRLSAKLHGEPGRLEVLDDDALRAISDEIVGFCREVAALSATAPTTMDARVARSVGTHARMLADVHDRELRRREVFPDQPIGVHHRPDVDQVTDRLRQFEVAVEDLRTHVELL